MHSLKRAREIILCFNYDNKHAQRKRYRQLCSVTIVKLTRNSAKIDIYFVANLYTRETEKMSYLLTYKFCSDTYFIYMLLFPMSAHVSVLAPSLMPLQLFGTSFLWLFAVASPLTVFGANSKLSSIT